MFTVDVDRITMAYTLAFHIMFVCVSLSLPVVMVVSEYLGLRKNDRFYNVLAKRLSIALIIFFAVGTASGIAVAAEMLVLFPGFMSFVGKVAILPLYVEVFAFFGESIALGIYVYSWDRIKSRRLHIFLGSLIAFFANMSGVLIIMLNAWMNTPNGFNIAVYLQNGTLTDLNPLAVFMTPSTPVMVVHGLVSTLFTGSFLLTGYFAFRLLGSRTSDTKKYFGNALKLSFALTMILFIPAGLAGSLSMDMLYAHQPAKYAALDLNMISHNYANEVFFGITIPIPGLQSLLATGSFSGFVPGLNQFPVTDWPPLLVHDTFDAMVIGGILVGIFFLLSLLSLAVSFYLRLKGRTLSEGSYWKHFHPFNNPAMLRLTLLLSLVSLFIMEAGWVTDEVGRQPWIVYNVMRTAQAANISSGVLPVAILLMTFYAFMFIFTIYILRRIFINRDLSKDLENYATEKRIRKTGAEYSQTERTMR